MSLYDRDYMRDDPAQQSRRNRAFSFFHAVLCLNIAVFFVQFVLGEGWVTDSMGQRLHPTGGVSLDDLAHGRYWTLLTYMFVHGSAAHILMNMLVLWFAGKRVQQIYGPLRFLQIYLVSGIIGAAVELTVIAYALEDTSVPLVGASAACFGVLTAFAAARPREPIVALVYFIIPIRARLLTLALVLVGANVVLGVLSLVHLLPAWLNGGSGMVAYFAHLGGAVTGWFFARSLAHDSKRSPSPADNFETPVRRRRPELARVTRRPAVELDLASSREENPSNDPVIDLMRNEVDPILDKISEQGMHSLTDEERRTLDRASRQIRRDRKV